MSIEKKYYSKGRWAKKIERGKRNIVEEDEEETENGEVSKKESKKP